VRPDVIVQVNQKSMLKIASLLLLLTLNVALANEDISSLKEESVAHSQNLLDVDALKTAFSNCEKILDIKDNDFDTMVLYSRLCWSIGKQDKDERSQKQWFAKGREMGKKIKELFPNKADGYYWHTVNYGEWVDRSSIFQKIGAKKIILTDMNRVIELDDKYDGGGAYIVIGRINFIAPGGSYPKAIECYEKAMKIQPKRTTAFLYLAELYLHEHIFDKSQDLFHKVLKMEIDPRYAIEAAGDKIEAAKYLKKSERKEDYFPPQETISNGVN
jgi:tetratricopeptide (TPR) repeat protein